MQLQAGYVFDFIKKKLSENHDNSEVTALFKSLSFFETDSNNSPIDNTKPELAVISNLLSKGLPTRPSLFLEQFFLDTFKIGEIKTDELGSMETIPNNSFESISKLLFESLHVIDHRIRAEKSKLKLEPSIEFAKIGSKYEEDFLFRHIPQFIGEEWFQLMESQREFTSIVNSDSAFTKQRTDFTIEFPYKISDRHGIVIEIDGPHHWENQSQIILDRQRDTATANADWLNTLRIQTRNFGNIQNQLNRLKELSKEQYFQLLKQNYENPLYQNETGLKTLQVVLSPFAIARLQKVLILSILQNKLNLLNKKWNIAVIERDVPCAALAIADLQQQIKSIFALKDEHIYPEIELTVFVTPEFKAAEINKYNFEKHFSIINFIDIGDAKSSIEFDLLLDVSILQRKGFSGNEIFIPAKNKVVIRSSHHQYTKRQFLTSDIISYSNFATPNIQEQEETVFEPDKVLLLQYFLQNVFRKQKFREGQLAILNKALQGQSVIGLLPTGGGKSLTYQLAALMQAGICLVIDPIKSLMKDQFDSLNRNQIDACNYINSSLKTREDKERESLKLKNGEVLFTFVSPERLQMKEFRDTLKAMNEKQFYFNYCVIDEAHCVSEWGHDFRTSYLSLGKNAIAFCKTKNKETIPLFGLTATASFDVLSDVQRELSGNNDKYRLKEDSVIRFDTVNREELNYEIIDVNANLTKNDDEWKLKEKLGTCKQTMLINQLSKFPFDKSNDYAGIIFCPHKGWYFGVTDRYKVNSEHYKGVYDAVSMAKIPNIKMGSFMGSDADDEKISELIETDSIQAQEDFIGNKLNLLVSTKAFGMGIDKPNIRFTFHINYPSSIESFVQEAGRAGRDKQPATCFILFNDENIPNLTKKNGIEIDRDNLLFFHNSSFKGSDKEKAILNELLIEIHCPDKTSEIEQLLFEEFEVVVNCKIKQTPDWTRLYVDGEYPNSYGYLNLMNLEINSSYSNFDNILSTRICTKIKEFLIEESPSKDWLKWIQEKSNEKGIERRLMEIDYGAEVLPKIVLKFSNDTSSHFDLITKALQKWEKRFDKDIVLSAKSNSSKFVDFVEKLEEGFTKKTKTPISIANLLTDDAFLKFKAFYNCYRDKADTEKALYRLSTVGIIDDYTIDFNSKTYTIYAKRKTDEQYFTNLENHIRKYYSEIRTKQEIKKAKEFEGETAIQQCLNFLTDFVYREIEKKRFAGISAMKEACIVGKNGKGTKFTEFIDLYFNSKYAKRDYQVYNEKILRNENKSLFDKTEGGSMQDIELVWEFIEVLRIDKSGSEIDNLKHLRGACLKMFSEKPENIENATLHLLKSFSIFILESENKVLLNEASKSFSKGFLNFQTQNNWSIMTLQENANVFKKYVIQYNSNPILMKHLENLIQDFDLKPFADSLIQNLAWLTNFNNRFLERYERRN